MTRLENGLNSGDRATGLGLNIQGMEILLSASKNLEIQSTLGLETTLRQRGRGF